MTLVELLVAFGVFLILVGLLVSLSTTGLETWQEGESRKDAYDRGRLVLDQVSDDLRCTFADTQWHFLEERRLLHAGLTCDIKEGLARLRFVRTGREEQMKSDPAQKITRPRGQGLYTDLWEIAYVLNPEGRAPGLYRGVRYFDRGSSDQTLLENKAIENTKSDHFAKNFTLLDPGILWISYKFWTKYTTTWDPSAPVKDMGRLMKQVNTEKEANEKLRVGPLSVWDSSRGRVTDFKLMFKQLSDDDPDFAYPEIVQVTVVVESQASDAVGARLVDVLDESASMLRVSTGRGVPEPPDYVLIDKEWIGYQNKEGTTLKGLMRGQRGTKAARHDLNAAARFGETFVTDVALPAYREPVR